MIQVVTVRRVVRNPQQARSRATYRRLVAAAHAALGDKGFDDISVAEIARRAGLTVGAFYARFESKEALFAHLVEQIFDQTRKAVADLRARAESGDAPIALLRELVAGHAALYRRQRPVIRSIVLRSQGDSELRERLRELSRQNFAAVAQALEASGQIQHPDLRLALEFALYAERSVLREAILFGEGWAKERRWSTARIVEETVRLIARYLGVAEQAGAPAARQRKEPR